MTNQSVEPRSLLLVALFLLLSFPTQAYADTITIGHGDQFTMTLNNSDTVKIEQTVLFTSNKTAKAYMEETMSIDGSLVGEPTIVADSSIENADVLWKSADNVTTFIIRVNVTLEPSKFKAVRLTYYLAGIVKHENDGTWLFNRVFNMTAESIAPPEIVVKVPKPSQWEDLKFQEIVPTPSSLIEEEGFYVMSWKSSAITFENTTETFVRLRYSLNFNPMKVILWLTPTIIGLISGFVIARLWDYRKQRHAHFTKR
jgi:hypothetical protein